MSATRVNDVRVQVIKKNFQSQSLILKEQYENGVKKEEDINHQLRETKKLMLDWQEWREQALYNIFWQEEMLPSWQQEANQKIEIARIEVNQQFEDNFYPLKSEYKLYLADRKHVRELLVQTSKEMQNLVVQKDYALDALAIMDREDDRLWGNKNLLFTNKSTQQNNVSSVLDPDGDTEMALPVFKNR